MSAATVKEEASMPEEAYVVALRALPRADGHSFTCLYKIEDGANADTAGERAARGGIDLDPVWCEVYGRSVGF